MTDLATILREAAPSPRSPLDFEAVRTRAQRRPWRRVVGAVGVVGSMLSVGLLVGSGSSVLVQTDQGPTPVVDAGDPEAAIDDGFTLIDSEQSDEPGSLAETASTDEQRVSSDAEQPRQDSHPEPPAPISVDDQVDSPSPQPGPDSPDTEARTAPGWSYSEAASCSVDTKGLAVGASRRCQFEATAPGSAAMRGAGAAWSGREGPPVYGEVTVWRDGVEVYHWHSDHETFAIFAGNWKAETDCRATYGQGPSTFIEPGDYVDVTIESRQESQQVYTLGAGEGWKCELAD